MVRSGSPDGPKSVSSYWFTRLAQTAPRAFAGVVTRRSHACRSGVTTDSRVPNGCGGRSPGATRCQPYPTACGVELSPATMIRLSPKTLNPNALMVAIPTERR